MRLGLGERRRSPGYHHRQTHNRKYVRSPDHPLRHVIGLFEIYNPLN
ncbi:hypothetical protein J0895_01535 [Phormidium pseudopriestleyi FRX01]|uniref:Uncharacterized protein n=1 Tax=Phormidium pseudopriestleyi FRX01 TaxID=1759528 RepID=A0ABS3FL51_9CYAN|nr:hypothetical protein [Phormidium pseudopriestleyi]MBO0347810.1 hypothetical protein [Phormidium pseudopriestleyi FRX01]